ncbi:MAG: VOC family protein [Gammaproteobacteria bacterium]|nr:VOC family protein [Gammaproteobacteria bacterium]
MVGSLGDCMASFAYVTLQVGDIPRVRDWYVEVVGLHLERETAGQIAVLRGEGGCRLCLESGPPVSEPSRVDLLFEVASVDETHARLVRRGATFWRGPTDELYGHRNAILFDPVGHKVEFFERLAET